MGVHGVDAAAVAWPAFKYNKATQHHIGKLKAKITVTATLA